MFHNSGRPLYTLLLTTYIPEDGRQKYVIPLPGEVSNPTQVLPKSYPKPADPIIPHETHLSDTLFNASSTPFGPFRTVFWNPSGLPFGTLWEPLRNPRGIPGAPPGNCACWGSMKTDEVLESPVLATQATQ